MNIKSLILICIVYINRYKLKKKIKKNLLFMKLNTDQNFQKNISGHCTVIEFLSKYLPFIDECFSIKRSLKKKPINNYLNRSIMNFVCFCKKLNRNILYIKFNI